MKYCFEIKGEGETLEFGKSFAKNLKGGAFIALFGDLGAGKTVFVRGLAQGLEIKERVLSPTFTVMCQYYGTKMLCHFDLYRITEDDCYSMGFDDFFFDENVVCAVEWSERLTYFPKNLISVSIEKTGEETRKITVTDENEILISL